MRPAPTFLGTCLLALGAVSASPAQADDGSIKALLDSANVKYTVDQAGDYKVTYNYEREGRTQLVFVSGRTEQVSSLKIREVFSPAARLSKDGITDAKAMELLESSSMFKLGSWEIRGDTLYFVIKIPEPLSATELEAAMDIAAESADNKEIELSGSRDEL